VLHPDLLAKVIRPQEPQPDLLGSLLQESGITHARRMAVSLAIYVVSLGATPGMRDRERRLGEEHQARGHQGLPEH
jgi:hypothetical protein